MARRRRVFGGIPVPIETAPDQAQLGQRFRQVAVDLERVKRGGLGLCEEIRRWGDVEHRHHDVGAGESGVGQSVSRVFCDRPFEVLDALLQVGWSALAPVVTSLEIEVIGIGVLGIAPRQPLALFPGQRQAQVLDNLLGDLVLDVEQVHAAAVEAVAPQLGVLLHVDELGLHAQEIAALLHLPGEERLLFQLPSRLDGIQIAALLENAVLRGEDAQTRDLRQPVDEAFRNAIAQILRVRIGRGVRERQDGQRINRRLTVFDACPRRRHGRHAQLFRMQRLLELFEIPAQIASRLVTPLALLGQAAAHDALKVRQAAQG